MEIHPLHTAWHIEKCFRERFGLHIMIYRKTQKGWTLAPSTRDMTLQAHNELGRMAVEAVPVGLRQDESSDEKQRSHDS
ncbi:hypothetical protein WJU16_22710 [Chitinophaga pollutisoli]|uniref:Uncharacterized protein n=1 Tax=Chitinophaga pollutisoli TaxID=3133966 RepID=A0ABZ2YN88_9BACT